MYSREALTHAIKAEALRLGFDFCGVAQAGFLETEARQLEAFLAKEHHGKMTWLEGHFDLRTDPRLLVPGAKSVISVLKNYFPAPADRQQKGLPKISTYAYGQDYHRVIKQDLIRLAEFVESQCGAVNQRWFTDSAPVMDKAWARLAGLGWIGKNTNLIRPGTGSFFFIGELILDVKLTYDGPMRDFCGTCTRCIDACPTGALTPYQIDSRKCISYQTIELKDRIEDRYRGEALAGWAYGCDICQDVCPWNRFAQAHNDARFKPLPHLNRTPEEWEATSGNQFDKLMRPTAMGRIRKEKWLDNLAATCEGQ